MNKFFERLKDTQKSRRRRILARAAAFSLFFLCLELILSHIFTEKMFIASSKASMKEIATKIESFNLDSNSYFNDIAEIEAGRFYIEIYSLPDTLIYTTKSNEAFYDFSPDIGEIQPKERTLRTIEMPQINDDGSFFDIKQEINGTVRYIVYNTTIYDTHAIKIYDSLDIIENNAVITERFFGIFCVSFFIAVTATIFLYEVALTKPIITINKVAKKIAALNFDEKCPDFKLKELSELSKSINHLSSALDMSLTDLKEKNEQLVQDIQKEQQLDKIRNEFISNASHELKTPISIIQGYAEGLKIGIADGENTEEYCDIIIEESEKMNTLVLKLLEISQYESGFYKLQKSRFNILYAVESLLKPRVKLLKEDGITLCLNINPDYIGYGDVSKIDTVINNYVSNAVSHVSGDKLIIVNCQPVGKKYRVSVFNSGENIKDEDIDKIWMSFYRADKSHSRAAGRFGLGLSFVKSIQEMHSNDYGIINRENGVEFWFDISKAHKTF